MRVKTFTLRVEMDHATLTFRGLSRVAVRRYTEWYREHAFAHFYLVEEE